MSNNSNNASKANNKANKKNINNKNNTEPKKSTFRRNNYWKYDEVKEPLRLCFEKDMTIAEAAKAVGISPMTVHKYKSMLSLENGKQYVSRDERAYLEIHIKGQGKKKK